MLPGEKIQILDHGFVQLVDVMGGDQDIVDAARLSVSGENVKTVQSNEGLIRYLLRNRHCYDAETEVLTTDGFVKWPDVKGGTKLGIWDPQKQSLCYETPEYLTDDSYTGDMYRVTHGGVDLLVTPDHKMWVCTRDGTKNEWRPWALIPANELGDRSMVRYSKLAPYTVGTRSAVQVPNQLATPTTMEAFGEFLGFFVGDGYASGRGNLIEFNFRKERKIEYLRELVSRLGWGLSEKSKFWVTVEDASSWFREQCYDTEGYKRLPNWVLSTDQAFQKSVLRGLQKSDGSTKRGAWEYSTNSETLAKQFQILGLHCGEAVSVNNGEPLWRLMVLSRMREPVINQGKIDTGLVPYSGRVYCAKTRTGILVVRRNGKIVLSANTTPFEMVEFKFRCKMPILVARQWVRHRTASLNEMSARYSELPAEWYVPEIEDIKYQADKNKQGRKDEVLENAQHHQDLFDEEAAKAFGLYRERLNDGMARELARGNLPLSTYTVWIWKIDLHNLFHFLGLRAHSHAQLEIRVFAEAMCEMVKERCPIAYEAFEDYRLHAAFLSRQDQEAIRYILANHDQGFDADIVGVSEIFPTGREYEEFKTKWRKIASL